MQAAYLVELSEQSSADKKDTKKADLMAAVWDALKVVQMVVMKVERLVVDLVDTMVEKLAAWLVDSLVAS